MPRPSFLPVNLFLSTLLACLSFFANAYAGSVRLSQEAVYINERATLLVGGSLQWFRLPPSSWEDRILKFKAAGFNTIEVYVPWNLIEPVEGNFDFQSHRIQDFLDLVQKHGLYIYLRPGPYITNEMDGGGLPAWLSAKADKTRLDTTKLDGTVNLRTADRDFLWYVERYFRELNQRIEPYLFSKGGPIILYALENEYNWFEFFSKLDKYSQLNGKAERPKHQNIDAGLYLQSLFDMLRAQGIDIPLVTCPGEPKLTGLGGIDIAPMPNIYGAALDHTEDLMIQLRRAMEQDQNYKHYPLGISETNRQPSVQKRLMLAGTDAIFQFNLAGYHTEGRSNAMVLNVAPPGGFVDLIKMIAAMIQLKPGYSILRPPVGFFHNVLDFYGPISSSGLLRPSFYDFRRNNLFLNSFNEYLAKAHHSYSTSDLASPVTLLIQDPRLGVISPDAVVPKHYWLDLGDEAALLGIYNGSNRDVLLPANSLKAWGKTFPKKTMLHLVKSGHELGPEASRRDFEYVHFIPINFPLNKNLKLSYSTSEILFHRPFEEGHLLVLYGAGAAYGEFHFQCKDSDLRLLEKSAQVKIIQQGSGSITLSSLQKLGEGFRIHCGGEILQTLVMDRDHAGRLWPLVDREDFLIGGVDFAIKDGTDIHIEYNEEEVKKRGYVFYTYGANIPSLPNYTPISLPKFKLPHLQFWQVQATDLVPNISRDFSLSLAEGSVQREAIPAYESTAKEYQWIPLGKQPDYLEKFGIYSGHAWYRGTVHLGSTDLKKDLAFKVASASDFVGLYINGHYLLTLNPLGTEINSSNRSAPYKFKIPKNFLKPGMNQVLVRNEIWGHGSVAWPHGTINSMAAPFGGTLTLPFLKIRLPALSYDSFKGLAGPASLGNQKIVDWTLAPGIAGERAGWYLPQFVDDHWPSGRFPLHLEAGTLIWYRTSFREDQLPDLQVQKTPLALTLKGRSAKASIYLNGRLIGRWLSDNQWLERGNWASVSRDAWMNTPADSFPVDRGLLQETNTLAILFEDTSDRTQSLESGKIDSLILEFAKENKSVQGSELRFVANPSPYVKISQ